MPTGFNLFSLDMFKIFKPNAPKAELTPEEMPLPSLGRDNESKDRDREQEAEIAFWVSPATPLFSAGRCSMCSVASLASGLT